MSRLDWADAGPKLLSLSLPLALVCLVLALQPAVVDTIARALDTAPPTPARPAPLVWLGLYTDRCMAGAAGGYVHMMRAARQGTSFWAWARGVAAGALMGNYLPSLIAVLIPAVGMLPDGAYLGGAFLLGYAGFAALARIERTPDGPGPSSLPPAP